jgi:hypothetical protein
VREFIDPIGRKRAEVASMGKRGFPGLVHVVRPEDIIEDVTDADLEQMRHDAKIGRKEP